MVPFRGWKRAAARNGRVEQAVYAEMLGTKISRGICLPGQ
jgi:hypothetical protein